MNPPRLLLNGIIMFGMITSGMTSLLEKCDLGQRSGFVSLEIITWRNSSGHRNIKSDFVMPQFSTSSDKTTMVISHFNTVLNGVRLSHISSFLTVQDVRSAPTEYELVPEVGWYRFHSQSITWEEAKTTCESEGGHLAVVNSQEEANALSNLFQKYDDKVTSASYSTVSFIGFSDQIEGKYMTILGQTLEEAGFSVWAPDQPNNLEKTTDPDQDCGGIEVDGKLNDVECNAKLPFFCEYPL